MLSNKVPHHLLQSFRQVRTKRRSIGGIMGDNERFWWYQVRKCLVGEQKAKEEEFRFRMSILLRALRYGAITKDEVIVRLMVS